MAYQNGGAATGNNACKIIVSVDFGTTFTGVAWAQTARPETQSLIIDWPGTSGSIDGATNDKVPTEIAYEGLDVKWGFQIFDDDTRYQWFKLDLTNKTPSNLSYLSIEYPDPKAAPPSYDKTAKKLTTDYLNAVRCHVLKILKMKLGKVLVETTPIVFVITVPAIWTEAAKFTTRQCAMRAGMGHDLQIVSEPEAAVIYTLDTVDPAKLKTGDTFVVCDAGDGTVDLISYLIEETVPKVKVREAAPGSGSACGSTFLNRLFSKWLQSNFSDNPGWQADTLEDALGRLENVLKRKFDGSDGNFIVPVAGLVDDPEKGIRRSKLTMSASSMQQIFEPVISTICALVTMQISLTSNVRAVLLVGGFGQNPYLRESLRKVVGEGIEIVQPANGWTAVARGALIKGLAEACPTDSRISIASRVARKAYGSRVHVKYVPKQHDRKRRFWSNFYGDYRVNIMDWNIKKGDALKEDEPLGVTYGYEQEVSKGPLKVIRSFIYCFETTTTDELPQYQAQGEELLVRLTADLSSIPCEDMPIKIGADGKEYYSFDYQICIFFYSANMSFSLWHNDKCYGTVDAKYD